ncbi:GDSL-type esterase/lipase family protein [Sphingobacterium sp. BN32]|uniref:GDSL-type esterase/lipase family protein n=1 Tax=Sphingobacterium sp. BN32 TaxID=3058432 RepID=UPI00265D0D7E|nr:GDSL-type esterase/lipase family protein [Sphingobacterium sp. BN32]WKK59421.1 GDSL-type esterase/lipase family protein [Sphingobacterium sp. BN32]
MKLRYLSLLLLGLFSKNLSAQVAIDSNYVFSGYTERLALFNKMPIKKGAVIFLGDSLTEAGRWEDIAPELPILNRGISGDISFGVVARLDEIIRHKPKKLFVMIGVNDLKRNVPVANILENYTKIIKKVQAESPKTNIYLSSLLPINDAKLIEAFKQVKNDDILKINAELKQIATKNRNVTFVDLYPVIADEKGQLKAAMTPDGIHLEVAAYIPYINYLKSKKHL